MSEYTLYAKALVGLLAIINPLGAIPIFLSLCGDKTAAEYRKIARTSSFAVAMILLLSIWAGETILNFFGISIPAFRTGGGLLILLMAISMLHAKQSHTQQTPHEAEEANDKESIAVVPLAIPLMAGPGAISLVIVDAHQIAHLSGRIFLSVSVIVAAVIVLIALSLAKPIGDKLGVTGLNISTRIMGLLLAAIGIQMITSGIVKLLPGLA
ncbi:MarC family protein [uncultured Desulfuromusa sp.]|uniref:MarC family protein n=1 Tax=uncultured Desulfuromusa sp. TaxID=219183 RepID=UPI002AA826F4|nr:MarC family protein [uncultured Desulfuromusa sp.]